MNEDLNGLKTVKDLIEDNNDYISVKKLREEATKWVVRARYTKTGWIHQSWRELFKIFFDLKEGSRIQMEDYKK